MKHPAIRRSRLAPNPIVALWLATIAIAWPLCAQIAPPSSEIAVPKLEPRPFLWTRLALDLPPSIEVFSGDAVNSDGQIVRAWFASVDYSDRSLRARAALSNAALGRESTSALAKQIGALVAINGGYFDMKSVPSKTYSLVMSDGQILAANVANASRANGRYFLTRSALGIRADRSFDVAWIAHIDDKILAYPAPSPNTYAAPAPAPSATFPTGATVWNAREAIGGAPVLIESGADVTSAEAEAIPAEMTLKTHPRTAIGFTPTRLILFVCDGRQPNWSMGLTLPELTRTMRDLGCVEALNLDGGGSSTFVVRDQVLNRPSDGGERNVSSIFALAPDAEWRVVGR